VDMASLYSEQSCSAGVKEPTDPLKEYHLC
jgi:hypothetical protein